MRDCVATAEREGIKAPESGNKELRQANEILRLASIFFAQADLDHLQEEVRTFIDKHRERFGVKLICKLLQVAPSAYWRYAARQRDLSLRSARTCRNEFLIPPHPADLAGQLSSLW